MASARQATKGHAYRNDGVDIKADNNGTYVTDTEAGEWLQYTLTAPDKGKYTLRLTTAAATATGKVYATVNGTKTKEAAILTKPVAPNNGNRLMQQPWN